MALLKIKDYQPVGVVFLIPPASRQGFFWREGMSQAKFFDHPKQLANDTVWLTNAHFDTTKNYGAYIKQYRFFRVPMHRLVAELGASDLPLHEQAARVGPFFSRLASCTESSNLYHAENMIASFQDILKHTDPPDVTWQQLGYEARTWYWKGAVKSKLLCGGSLYTPRFDFARQLIKCPVPDFSKPPKVIKGDFSGLVLINLLKEHVGFVRVRVENVRNNIIEFVDLNRTLLTNYEVLWLMQHADVSAKILYLTNPIPHPADDPERLKANFKPFSWLDGLRLEALALAPTYKNIAMDAFIRATAHIGMAHYAWYITTKYSMAPLAVSYGKLGIAFNKQEEPKIRKFSKMSGLLFANTEEEGIDLAIGKGF